MEDEDYLTIFWQHVNGPRKIAFPNPDTFLKYL